ncbi:MAG: nucleoid-structuring protein H-NS [Candidatus Margulisiibacteriota bacterium]|nr:MAG: nucleoid-structuring protein H-NS [Candidatus Margulisbacteria bacterium GWD2_39_127]OGI04568.1 MAG: nucleoid-structuring protein H-NS [Candidatus Margulisbacteria bacterium GWF2_38_17]OGI11900.1 MAG: nucleoid-structuring protein H-NS [Candidatus Margulisbacteria bacterium GWE2_39_32]PZM83087.1 MAG: nucleoid-structuring protein H-NS [Candidatus Margulisiibacteriota bacterium]HAR62246.1 nucleoid-structuring protein H-NS [Candidatus Margulisiibacteriota bacterium]
MFRKEIKVLDCTIRDGGLINKWDFSDDFVKAVLVALAKSGIDYMEIGYKASRKIISPDGLGKWRFCDEDDIRKVCEGVDLNGMKLSAMVDIGRVEADEIIPADKSVFDMVRVASYVKDIDKAIELVKRFHDHGYETTINIMAVSRALSVDLEEALKQLAESEVPTVYVVDSNGALYSEQIDYMVKKYQKYLPGKTIGIHAHNNQQLAYANTIESIIHGANMLDATVYGIGRGAGNCPLELLLGFLKNPKFRLRPVIELIEKEFIRLREKIEWGYIIPYAITGILDEHPRSAMELRDSAQKDEFTKFFDSFQTELII